MGADVEVSVGHGKVSDGAGVMVIEGRVSEGAGVRVAAGGSSEDRRDEAMVVGDGINTVGSSGVPAV